MTTTNKTTKITKTGYNKKEKQFYAVFTVEKKNYMITWRPTSKDDGMLFDVGILPVEEEKNGSAKRTNGQKNKNETGIGGDA